MHTLNIKTLLIAATALVLQIVPAYAREPLYANVECANFGIVVPQTGPVIVQNHNGGPIVEMERCRKVLEIVGREVRLRGTVNSSPTFLLGLSNACVENDAIVGFHATRGRKTGILSPDFSRILAIAYMPPKLAEHFIANWNTRQLHRVRGQQLAQLGVSICT